MLRFRRKIWVALLFALISIGQGFALSYVINLSQIHSIEYFESNAPVPSYLLVCGHDFGKSLKKNPAPSQKNHEEILSLKSDPFVPLFHHFILPSMESIYLSPEGFLIQELNTSPPQRPPQLS